MAVTTKGQAGRSILVTGSHRSGSTWVGKMLSATPGVVYIHEPFSLSSQWSPCYPRFTTWFTYVTPENEAPYRERIERLVRLRYPWRTELAGRAATPRHLAGTARRALAYRAARRRGDRPLIKDPIALMSAEWMASQFDTQIVALIRHPCAFVSSLKRMGWWFQFDELLKQPLLMRDLLEPFEEPMRRLNSSDHDMVENGALAWNVIHHVIEMFRRRHPDWVFVRHEDLAGDPLGQYESLYGRLGLTFDAQARGTIEEHCYAKAPLADQGQVHRLVRNSSDDAWSWQRRMPAEEVERIRERVEPISRHFYADETWNLSTAVKR